MPFNNPFTSKRLREVEADNTPPSPFAVIGGWGPATDPGYRPDPDEAERSARLAGRDALVQLEAQRVERVKAARDAQLAGVRLGRGGIDGREL